MNTRVLFIAVVVSVFMFLSCKNKGNGDNQNSSLELVVKNSLDQPYNNALIEMDLATIKKQLPQFNQEGYFVMADSALPFQINPGYQEKKAKLVFLMDLKPNQEQQVWIKKKNNAANEVEFEKRTAAEISIKQGGEWKKVTKKNGKKQYEYQGGTFKNIDYLRVPNEHTDHSFFIRYEGPGWESDKVGYRFYLDWRNAVDIFGKKTTDMVLHQVGQDGFDSYHENQSWGMDILKVGSSLGIGAVGFWDGTSANRVAITDSVTCKIEKSGLVQSIIATSYFGWQFNEAHKTDLNVFTSIHAGSRLTMQELTVENQLKNICTGIVKHDEGELFKSDNQDKEWGYVATFGNQSLNEDNMGMVVFYRNDDLIKVTDDEHSHVVVLKPKNGKITYAFAATWEKDVDQINSAEKFLKYLNIKLKQLNNKPKLMLKK